MRGVTAGLAAAAMLVAANGDPGRLAFAPAAADAAQVVCSSLNYQYNYCGLDARGGVQLTDQLSRAPCVPGQTWGSDSRGIWVNGGCSASFYVREVSNGGGNAAGAVVGAVILGGILGAILSNNDKNNHRPDYNRPGYGNGPGYRPPYYPNPRNGFPPAEETPR